MLRPNKSFFFCATIILYLGVTSGSYVRRPYQPVSVALVESMDVEESFDMDVEVEEMDIEPPYTSPSLAWPQFPPVPSIPTRWTWTHTVHQPIQPIVVVQTPRTTPLPLSNGPPSDTNPVPPVSIVQQDTAGIPAPLMSTPSAPPLGDALAIERKRKDKSTSPEKISSVPGVDAAALVRHNDKSLTENMLKNIKPTHKYRGNPLEKVSPLLPPTPNSDTAIPIAQLLTEQREPTILKRGRERDRSSSSPKKKRKFCELDPCATTSATRSPTRSDEEMTGGRVIRGIHRRTRSVSPLKKCPRPDLNVARSSAKSEEEVLIPKDDKKNHVNVLSRKGDNHKLKRSVRIEVQKSEEIMEDGIMVVKRISQA